MIMPLMIEPITEDMLYQMYHVDMMTLAEIAREVGFGSWTIRRRMEKCGMTRRTNSESQIGHDVNIPSEEDLRLMYYDDKMTPLEIGELVGVSRKTMLNWLKKYMIPVRTQSESGILLDNRGPKSPNWTGGPKTYCWMFNEQFREEVRRRDNYECQNCCKTQAENRQKLSVHHIHYDAKNCYPDVICLCKSCHVSSSSNRDEWEELCMILLEDRGILNWKPPLIIYD